MNNLCAVSNKSTFQSVRSGFTLTEIAIVLGVVGFVLGGIWVAASNTYRTQKINKLGRDFVQIVNNVQGIMYHQVGITPLVDVTAGYWAAGVFPSDTTLDGTGHPTNPWGGNIFIYDDNYTNKKSIRVSYYSSKISVPDCIDFTMTMAPLVQAKDNPRVSMIFTNWGGNQVIFAGGTQLTLAQAAAVCNTVSTGDLEYEVMLN
jgi:type II secretory pathway pseudopilin PulG